MTLFRPDREQRDANVLPWRAISQRVGRLPTSTSDLGTALTHSAVYECVDLIADLVAGFPAHRFREVQGTSVKIDGSSVIEMPSERDDAVNWRRIVVASWLLRGFAAGIVSKAGAGGYPAHIELVHPDRIGVERIRPDALPEWRLDGNPVELYPVGNLWIAPGKKLTADDPLGRSVLEFAARDIHVGLAASKFGADFFDAGGIPTSIVSSDQAVNQDLATRVKQRFLEAVGPSREPVVLGGGWKYEQIQIAPNESQFLETIKANRTIVAGFFKVPPHLIGAPSGDGMTYKNVEQDGLNLLRFCVQPWVTRMETTLTPLLPRPQYVKLNMDSLVRPDLGTRYRAHDVAIRAGFKSVNDVRDVEDLPPIPDGDLYLWPPYRSQLTEPEQQAGAVEEEPDA